jgi:hypothetical protein
MNKIILTIIFVVLMGLSFVSALSIKEVESFPQEIMPGETATISIEIENTLGEDVTNVNVKLDLSDKEGEPVFPFAPYQSSSERFIEELDDGEDETFEFEIIALPTTSSGIYKIPVEITYLDEEGKQGESEGLISLIVNSNVELKVFSEESILIRGKESTLSIKVINSGLSDIKFAYLITEGVAGIQFVSETEQYIGDIDSDDFDNIEYQVYVSPNAPSLISFPILLKYKDATNKEFEEERGVTVRVYSLKEAQERGFVKKPSYFIFVGIGLAVLLFIGYRIRKKRKLKAKK